MNERRQKVATSTTTTTTKWRGSQVGFRQAIFCAFFCGSFGYNSISVTLKVINNDFSNDHPCRADAAKYVWLLLFAKKRVRQIESIKNRIACFDCDLVVLAVIRRRCLHVKPPFNQTYNNLRNCSCVLLYELYSIKSLTQTDKDVSPSFEWYNTA